MRTSAHRLLSTILAAGALAALGWRAPAPAAEPPVPFIRGDADASGTADITDAVFILQLLFLGGDQPACSEALDANDDGHLSITDPVYLLLYLYRGGKPLAAPAGQCGLDLTPDDLGCASFPPCPVEVPCLDQKAIDDALGTATFPETDFCLPAGALAMPVGQITITACPAASAAPCGAAAQPGCGGKITAVKGSLDVANSRILVRIEGRIDDLPVEVTESILHTTTTCTTDFHSSADENLPFAIILAVPLVLEKDAAGDLAVKSVGQVTIDGLDMGITATGGLVCILFQAGQAAVVAALQSVLQSTLDSVLAGVTANLPADLTGLKICGG